MRHPPSRPRSPSRARPALLAVGCAALLAACGSDDDDGTADVVAPEPFDGTRYAFVSGATPVTFDAGQIERFEIRAAADEDAGEGDGSGTSEDVDVDGEGDGDTGGSAGDGTDASTGDESGVEIVSTGVTEATGSDIRVATDGRDVYQVGRLRIDSLTRYEPDDLDTPVWQYSVNGDETGSNPYEIVFASETKAYVIRYGSPIVWVVDPTAATEANFRTGTINLSAYDTVDGVPNASDAVIVDGKLFVLMQRLGLGDDAFAPDRDGYVAVIDTASDEEIDTGMGEDGLLGIALESSNPSTLAYLEETDEIYVVGRGNLFGNANVEADPYDGGIETIDPDSYVRDTILDDGTAEDNDGFIVDALVLSARKGYVLYYSDFGVTTLRSFDPITSLVSENAVAGLEARDISVLAEDPEGRVWVGLNVGAEDLAADESAMPGFTVLDPDDDSVLIEQVATELNPNGIVFVDVPAETDVPPVADTD